MKKILKVLFCIFTAFTVTFCLYGYSEAQKIMKKDPLQAKVEMIQSQENYTHIEEIPQIYKQAVIAVEDKRLYTHCGIDFISLSRAMLNDLISMSFKEGGSTISQQLAKNLYFSQEKTIQRKIAEAFVALEIERIYSKDEILELYINIIYYGNGYNSIREASLGYFNKEPKDLSDYEATWLAGIPNAPSVYGNDAELAAQRQKVVIDRMIECGFIDQKEIAVQELISETN